MKNTLSPATAAAIALLAAGAASAAPADRQPLAPPVTEGRWLRPAAQTPAQPVWGHAEGLCVGLSPLPGPRGVLRIYAPYLGLPGNHVINYIAVEPTVEGRAGRGYSELESSRLDGPSGKRFWSADDPAGAAPRPPDEPARGRIGRDGNVEVLRVFLLIEPFDNGARPYLRLTFRSDRPHEVGLAVFSQAQSRAMGSCVLTATMGNYARLRRLYLANRTVLASDLWPKHSGFDFTPHARFGLADLARTREGHVLAAATPNEAQPEKAEYGLFTPRFWKYQGPPATQYWRSADPPPALAVQVNGRSTYWGSLSAVPGGVAFENFEMVAPYREGQEFWFGVTTQTPAEMGLPAK